ncbi:MAG: alpha/beta fold hydrolase [Proteobacteria bacterium]|nr:alpha/beta fold hydrolase [Pseudomonadota bacterium]
MPTISRDGCRIHWERHGSGPAVMLIAGLGGVASYWTPQLAPLAARYTVIVHDQRGSGRSSRVPVASIEQMAADAAAVLDAAGVARATVVGHSTGGAIGMTMALDHAARVDALVINSSTGKPDVYRRKVFAVRRALLARGRRADYARYTSLLLYPSWWINQHAAEIEAEEEAAARARGSAAVQASRLDAILNFDRRAELPRIAVPTLVLCAADDILTPPYFSDEIHRLIPNARYVLLERGGHACSRTVTAAFNRTLLEFLAAQERSAP